MAAPLRYAPWLFLPAKGQSQTGEKNARPETGVAAAALPNAL
jgi:hypothetical protein